MGFGAKKLLFRKSIGAYRPIPCDRRMCLPGLGAWRPLACAWALPALLWAPSTHLGA